MGDDDRRHLYETLLRGLADECQDRLCAADEQHVWSPWMQTQLRHDMPLRFDPAAAIACNEVFRVKGERHCLNCGKEEVA